MTQKKKDKIAGALFILPSFIGVIIFVLAPFMDVIKRSFQSAVTEKFVGLTNYKLIFTNAAFKLAAKNTLLFIGVCIPLLIVFSLIVSVLLHKQEYLGDKLKTAFLLPMAIPVASVVLLWRVLFHQQGIMNGILVALGGEAIPWMESGFAFGVLVFSYIWKNLGYDVVLWVAGLNGISDAIYEAAKVDGAGEWQSFRYITLPNLLPTLYTIAILSFINSFKVFRESYLVSGDYPHESIYLLQNLFNNWFRDLSLDKMAAAAVVMLFVFLILVVLLQKAWDKQD